MAGWSATNLHWEGVAFETFYRMIIEPSGRPDTSVTHVAFGGLDGYRSVVLLEDALADGKPHPRARVWEEERHRDLPAWSVRRFYRLLIPPIALLCARGSRRGRTPPAPPGSRT